MLVKIKAKNYKFHSEKAFLFLSCLIYYLIDNCFYFIIINIWSILKVFNLKNIQMLLKYIVLCYVFDDKYKSLYVMPQNVCYMSHMVRNSTSTFCKIFRKGKQKTDSTNTSITNELCMMKYDYLGT